MRDDPRDGLDLLDEPLDAEESDDRGDVPDDASGAAPLPADRLLYPRVARLSPEVGGDGRDDATFADLAEARVPAPSDGVERLATARQLHDAMGRARLTERERAVLWLRYGLDDETPRRLHDIGAVLGIRHASQLLGHERAALRKLRAVLSGARDQAPRSERVSGR